jgi:hypothetical protein
MHRLASAAGEIRADTEVTESPRNTEWHRHSRDWLVSARATAKSVRHGKFAQLGGRAANAGKTDREYPDRGGGLFYLRGRSREA